MGAEVRWRNDEGVGLLPLTWGVLAFLLFLFLAVQVAVNLYATSTISAVGHDAARRVALAGGDPVAVADAEAWLDRQLGDSVTVVAAEWRVADGAVSLSLTVEPPQLLINRAGIGVDLIERTFIVRLEQASVP